MQTEVQKVSYIIGRQIGADFKQQSLDICSDSFAKGVCSALAGETSAFAPEEAQQIMMAFQAKMQEKANAVGDKNAEAGNAFLEDYKKQDGVQVTDSGLCYRVINTGSGKGPEMSSTVETHYEGKLIDGTIFDLSYARGETTSFPVQGVIRGWTEALLLMKEGDVWELAIPAELAYGARGAGGAIGPNETLLFKIELIAVK